MNGMPAIPPDSSDPNGWLRHQLFERRIVLLSGVVDDGAINEVGAALMTLDAMGDDPVHLQVDSSDGTTEAALALMDIIDLCGVAVTGTGLGLVAGPAAGVLAVCGHRILTPNARVRLYEPPVVAAGEARHVEDLAQAHIDRWDAFCSRLAAACHQPVDQVREDAAAGRFLTAEEAVSYGLADEVASPTAPVLRLPGRGIGFGAR